MAEPVFSQKTLIPIGLCMTILTAVISFHIWLMGQFGVVNKSLDAINYRLDLATVQGADRWTAAHQKIWELEMRSANPTLKIPSTWEITSQHQAK